MERIFYPIQEAPLGFGQIGAGGLCLIVQLVALVLIVGRRSSAARSWAPEVISAAAMLLPYVVAGWGAWLSTRMVREAIGPVDPSAKATFIAGGIAGLLNSGAILLVTTTLSLLLFALAQGIAASGRIRLAGSSAAARVVMIAAVLAGSLCGAFNAIALQFVVALITSFSAVAVADPSDKGRLLRMALEEAHAASDRSLLVLAVLWFVLAAGTFMFLELIGPARQRARRMGELGAVMIAGPCFAMSAIVLLFAAPYYRELKMPMPKGDVHSLLMNASTPELVGPDSPPRAAVIQLMTASMTVEGVDTKLKQLAPRLGEMREVHAMIYPNTPPIADVIIGADRDLECGRLFEVIGVLREAQYLRVHFLFARSFAADRPLLGHIVFSSNSAATVQLVHDDKAVRLTAPANGAFGALAGKIVAARAGGSAVFIGPSSDP